MSAHVAHLTQATFDETVNSADNLLVVDFWAEWCGPCKMIAPILDEIAVEKSGAISIAKVDVDHEQELAMRFDVMSIPTMIVFKNGVPVKRIVGAKGKSQLLAEFTDLL